MSCRARHDHSCGRLPLPRAPFGALLILLLSWSALWAQTGRVQKISATEGGFSGTLRDKGGFGTQVVSLGDLDGDGVTDLAVSAPGGFDAADPGSVWVVFLNRDGTVKNQRSISVDEPGPRFGSGIGAVGDRDGDGIPDLTISSFWRHYLFLLNPDASPKVTVVIDDVLESPPQVSHEGIRSTVFNAPDSLLAFGISKNGSGTVSLMRWTAQDGLRDLGDFDDPDWSIWLLSFPPKSGFASALTGFELQSEPVLAVGAPDAEIEVSSGREGTAEVGKYGRVFLLRFGFVRSGTRVIEAHLRLPAIRIDPVKSSLTEADPGDRFGASIGNIGDLNGDGQDDLAVGAPADDDGGPDRGAVWILSISPEGTVASHYKMSATTMSSLSVIRNGSRFGSSIAPLGDLNGDGFVDLAVGAPGDSDGGDGRGAVYIVSALPEIPPVVTLESVPTAPILIGTPLTVKARVVSTLGEISSANLVFTRGGDLSEFAIRMNQPLSDVYSADIPAFAVSERGARFYVTAANRTGSVSRWPKTGFISAQVLVPDGLSFRFHGGGLANGYRLISIPLALEHPSAQAVLVDDLGPYDPTQWRFFGNGTAGGLVEFGHDSLAMESGRAFWLLTKTANVQLNTGPGVSIRTDQPFEISLRFGWNYVGDPFAFPVPLSSIHLQSGADLDILTYSGAWEPVESAIEPFSGYIVYSSSSSERLVIDADPQSIVSGKGSPVGIHRELEVEPVWSIRVKATKGRARDDDNLLGVSISASDEWDRLDKPEPPHVWDYVSVHFPHEEWGRENEMFRTDIKSAECAVRGAIDATACSWILVVSAASQGAVDLIFERVETVPSELGVWLHDPASGVWQDLRLNQSYRVVVSGAATTHESSTSARRLEILVGVAGAHPPVEEPTDRFELSSFPNPFARSVTITYGLSEEAEVSMSVFNALGQRVVQLLDVVRNQAGRHAAVWDAVSAEGDLLAPGIYIVRLEVGAAVRSKLVTLSR